MRKSFWLCIASGVVASACTQVPDLDTSVESARIVDVVKRVKCDIYDAFLVVSPYRGPAPVPLSTLKGYEWLKDWTAQVDLSLIVNNQSGISPGATFTDPLHQIAVPGVGNFSRSFNLGLGGGANTTASRTESITFSLSVAEIETELDNDSRRSDFYQDCQPANGTGLHSDLKLKEWVLSALEPTKNGYLTQGHHKSPKGAGGAKKQLGDTKKGLTDRTISREFLATTYKGNGLLVDKALKKIAEASEQIKAPKGEGSPQNMKTIKLIEDATQLIEKAIDLVENNPDEDIKTVAKREGFKDADGKPDLKNLGYHLHVREINFGWFEEFLLVSDPPSYADVQRLLPLFDDDVVLLQKMLRGANSEITKEIQALISALQNAKKKLKEIKFDPPIDAISHQVQFIVALNASASPSWTLMRFKGPSPASGGLITGSHSNTHTLSIAMGSPSEAAKKLNALQIGTTIGGALNANTVNVRPQ